MDVVGMSLGVIGFIFGMSALARVQALEARLKKTGVLTADDTQA